MTGNRPTRPHGDTLNTALKVFTGAHQISVQSLDASGNVTGTSSSLNIVAEPGDIVPIANITITAMPNISPTTVPGCTAGSTDPDGFFIGHKLQYSDGSNFSIPAALETFPAPGSYTATATVTDPYGATSTTSKTFSVAGAAVSAVTSSMTKEEVAKQPQIPLEPSKPPQCCPRMLLTVHENTALTRGAPPTVSATNDLNTVGLAADRTSKEE